MEAIYSIDNRGNKKRNSAPKYRNYEEHCMGLYDSSRFFLYAMNLDFGACRTFGERIWRHGWVMVSYSISFYFIPESVYACVQH